MHINVGVSVNLTCGYTVNIGIVIVTINGRTRCLAYLKEALGEGILTLTASVYGMTNQSVHKINVGILNYMTVLTAAIYRTRQARILLILVVIGSGIAFNVYSNLSLSYVCTECHIVATAYKSLTTAKYITVVYSGRFLFVVIQLMPVNRTDSCNSIGSKRTHIILTGHTYTSAGNVYMGGTTNFTIIQIGDIGELIRPAKSESVNLLCRFTFVYNIIMLFGMENVDYTNRCHLATAVYVLLDLSVQYVYICVAAYHTGPLHGSIGVFGLCVTGYMDSSMGSIVITSVTAAIYVTVNDRITILCRNSAVLILTANSYVGIFTYGSQLTTAINIALDMSTGNVHGGSLDLCQLGPQVIYGAVLQGESSHTCTKYVTAGSVLNQNVLNVITYGTATNVHGYVTVGAFVIILLKLTV